MKELQSKGIHIIDYNSTGEDVDILIGADMIPFLVLDKSITLSSALLANDIASQNFNYFFYSIL